jgi:hypothetical protein
MGIGILHTPLRLSHVLPQLSHWKRNPRLSIRMGLPFPWHLPHMLETSLLLSAKALPARAPTRTPRGPAAAPTSPPMMRPAVLESPPSVLSLGIGFEDLDQELPQLQRKTAFTPAGVLTLPRDITVAPHLEQEL